ncbi:ABC transporter substrate-binding protein [Streptomyces sp. 8K308]|uniref:ABC transporter substrate-binding protein n=1 Tax=Streptomyces sp. 8K308 TaxID=2530388 RepID=UPI0010456C8D|nr:ABC transporter substrate-binding protein [Streptomyces sp. 8K308]TDC08527.1 ABC transporter substrate-binding protein [Streptomyces sp. 8K308]
MSAAAAALVLTALLAACTGETRAGGGSAGGEGVLTVSTGSTGDFVRDFDPFAPEPLQATHGMIYKPLLLCNAATSGDVRPWLGGEYAWSEDGRRLTVTIRDGVTWSDGEPFTADDVAYTFEVMTHDPALNQFALPIEAVTTEGGDTVVIDFTESALTREYFILGKTKMIPEHIWSEIPDDEKTTVLNENPVGTGPWTVSSVEGMTMELTARDDYYVEGLPHFDTLRYRSFTGNNAANAAITSGEIDWAGAYIPNVQSNYLDRDENFELVHIPLAVTYLTPKAQRGSTADPGVRHAISAALDRDFISESLYAGQAPPINPMALLQPNFENVLDPSLADAEFETGEDAVARHLTDAGYRRGPDGAWERDGERLTTAVGQRLDRLRQHRRDDTQQLADIGIELDVQAISYAQFTDRRNTGDFQLVPPGLCVAVLGAALSLVSFGLDEVLDPRLRNRGPRRGARRTSRKERAR